MNTIEPKESLSIPAQIWRHLKNWTEGYLWVPVSLLGVWLFAKMAYFLTGRKPEENVDWIVGMAGNLVKCVFLILLTSIFVQAVRAFIPNDQRDNEKFVLATMALAILALCVFCYALSH